MSLCCSITLLGQPGSILGKVLEFSELCVKCWGTSTGMREGWLQKALATFNAELEENHSLLAPSHPSILRGIGPETSLNEHLSVLWFMHFFILKAR